MKRSIAMVVDGAYPQDIRVRKEAETLVDSGFKVLVICPRKSGLEKSEIVNGVQIYRIGSNYTTLKKGLNDIFGSFFNVNLFFYFRLSKIFKTNDIGAMHVHDLPLASTILKFKKQDIPLILDLHENYPEALKTWFSWRQSKWVKFKNKLFMNPAKWSRKEERYVEKYDWVICVVEEMKDKLIRKFKSDPTKLIVISNHEKKNFTSHYLKKIPQNIIDKHDYAITYVGGFGPHRGLDTAIKAMPLILGEIPLAKLYLVGSGHPDVLDRLEKLVRELDLEKHVIFAGQRPFEEVATIMATTDINIIPHHSNEHTDNTIPHKLFQIMMSEKTLLVSSCKPLERIVKKYDAGYVFEASSEVDFYQKVNSIHSDQVEAKRKSDNARKAIIDQGENWDEEGLKLVSFYKKIGS